jgi:serpin B
MRRLKFFSGFILLFTICCSATSCKANIQTARADVSRETVPSTSNLSTLVTDNTEFAFDLYHQIASEQDGNLIFSPYSISLGFAMVYAGARGETAAQIAETLHYTLSQEQLHNAFNALDLALSPPSSSAAKDDNTLDNLTLSIANAVWGQEGFPFEKIYLDTLGLNYGAAVNLTDFRKNPEGARQAIQQWVEEATNGRIKDIPPPGSITPSTRLALLNAIYFKGEWRYPFNSGSTYDGTFHLADGAESSVPMMINDIAYMECGRINNYYAVKMTYGIEETAAMLILLPDEGRFHDFESRLDADLFQSTLEEIYSTNSLKFTMPRFKFESAVDLRASLSVMGMTIPFSDSADFTGISPNSLFFDYAQHKATISVDELGTEAAGTTNIFIAISGVMSRCGPEIIADRPFVFTIYDEETQAILFLGRVMNPAE